MFSLVLLYYFQKMHTNTNQSKYRNYERLSAHKRICVTNQLTPSPNGCTTVL